MKIIWSDEANFRLSDHVSRHNCVYWDVLIPALLLKLPWTNLEYLCGILFPHLMS
jgi:hypothetical protein